MYHTGGSRCGVMTTNLVESYHMIMCGVSILPLVGIVEFIFYDCTNYNMKCHGTISLTLLNLTLVNGERITEYMAKKVT
jgi:hypothetical protein